ncbi:hypothetical protein MGN70_008062 [Eutypa lata]|uniref:Secreted protein n=1 Tax=Eutypa lata (strain UCR-EL1) TaxID=1287681 RepID=M7SMN8_EUTLA|nr:hypothetical protein UCREL1_7343 [Eutypa lata UCREL1]KAI1251001.1 hypothetical protein MGN70_008062 [Eutypa lata]
MKFTSSNILLPVALTAVAVTADTLTVNTFSDVVCGGAIQSFKLGKLDECHQMTTPFRSFTTSDVAQSFFGKGVRVKTWSTNNCEGSSITVQNTFALSNAGGNCHVPFADVNDGQPNPFKVWSFQVGVYPA